MSKKVVSVLPAAVKSPSPITPDERKVLEKHDVVGVRVKYISSSAYRALPQKRVTSVRTTFSEFEGGGGLSGLTSAVWGGLQRGPAPNVKKTVFTASAGPPLPDEILVLLQ